MFDLSMATNPSGSMASGWQVYEYPPGSWHWSAYGPRGGSQGRGHSKDDARRKAIAESENLKGPGA